MCSVSNEMKRLVIIGASGHAAVVCDAAVKSDEFEVLGFLDGNRDDRAEHAGFPILGHIEDIEAIVAENRVDGCVVAIGDNATRGKVALDMARICPEIRFLSVIHPTAIIGDRVSIGDGTVVLAGTIINPGCVLGEHCIVNTGSQLDHDSVIGDFSSLAPAVVTGGKVEIGDYTALGLGVTVLNSRTIGKDTVIGAGSLVTRDIGDLCVAYGSPARVVREREHGEHYL